MSNVEPVVVDVRAIPKPQRHAFIFDTMEPLAVGHSVVVKNDHDPIPLRGQVEAIYGDQFGWNYLQEGPEIFLLQFTRRAPAPAGWKRPESKKSNLPMLQPAAAPVGPKKRHAALRELSVDHHHALVQAHRLQRAANADEATRRDIVEEFFSFWNEQANPHFREEEEALLPFFARFGSVDAAPIRQMQCEHILLRRDVAVLRAMGTYDVAALRALGARLEAHVRLEERVVFPLIEETLPDDALAALPQVLAAWHSETRVKDAAQEEKPMPAETQNNLPGDNLPANKMPGHWLLARLGKKVLRPGGLELTRHLLEALNIGPDDCVVEFAPGMGATAQLALARNPASYVAVERDKAAAAALRAKLEAPNREFRTGRADATGLPPACASIVYGEAMLTMQTPAMKEKIVREAARLLKNGGHYGIHELCLVPDDLDEATATEIAQAISGSIHVGARPLRVREWRTLLESEGLAVAAEHRVPMELLEPARLIEDEGVTGAVRIVWNVLHDAEALSRVREMRAVFCRYRDHLAAVALVAVKTTAP